VPLQRHNPIDLSNLMLHTYIRWFSWVLIAIVFGDPHVITLHECCYTFNGKGEFSLIETQGDMFTLQGRIVQAVSGSGESSLATVFSAIVGKSRMTQIVHSLCSAQRVELT